MFRCFTWITSAGTVEVVKVELPAPLSLLASDHLPLVADLKCNSRKAIKSRSSKTAAPRGAA